MQIRENIYTHRYKHSQNFGMALGQFLKLYMQTYFFIPLYSVWENYINVTGTYVI